MPRHPEVWRRSKCRLVTTVGSVTAASTAGPQKTVTLSNGDTLHVDLYLPMLGVRPNMSFLPDQLLHKHGNLKLDRTL
jgi:hypothetical protein